MASNIHSPEYDKLKHTLKVRVLQQLERNSQNGSSSLLSSDMMTTKLRPLLQGLRRDTQKLTLSPQQQEQLLSEVVAELLGVGPLEPLLTDPDISEIMVNGPTQIFVERHGRLEPTEVAFRDTEHLMSVIERLLDVAGVSVTSSEPCVDASLPDGSRVNVIIPPLVLNGPTVTIRKKATRWTLEDFIRYGSLSRQAAEFLAACVKAKVNLVISGGSSTAKTTLVSVLSEFIPAHERIITIENVAELELPGRDHWIRLVARGPNIEGRGEIPLRTLVRNALRMRPDRIVLGEARGGEALDVVQGMQTGHEGVITVLHANSPQAALERLATLMLMSGVDLLPQACQVQIANAVDLVVHLGRFADGSRRVSSIAHVLGGTSGSVTIEELFVFEVRGFRPDGALEGELRYTGIKPKFAQKFQLNNVEVPAWVAV